MGNSLKNNMKINTPYLKVIGTGSKQGNCLAIYDSRGKYMLFDVGLRYTIIINDLSYNLQDCVGVCVSHEHGDHCKSLVHFINRYIPCYSNIEVCSKYIGCNVLPKVLFLNGFKIQNFDLEHNVSNTAFVIDTYDNIRCLYITDTKSVSKRVKNVNYAIVECNYDNDILIDNMVNNDMSHSRPENHLCLDDCIDYLKEIYSPALQGVVLWHLSDSNIDEKMALKKVKAELGFDNVYIAEKGLKIELQNEEF